MTLKETSLIKVTPTDKGAIALYLPTSILDECVFEECDDDEHGMITLIYPLCGTQACFEVKETVEEIISKVESDDCECCTED